MFVTPCTVGMHMHSLTLGNDTFISSSSTASTKEILGVVAVQHYMSGNFCLQSNLPQRPPGMTTATHFGQPYIWGLISFFYKSPSMDCQMRMPATRHFFASKSSKNRLYLRSGQLPFWKCNDVSRSLIIIINYNSILQIAK